MAGLGLVATEGQKAFLEYLFGFVSPHKKALFYKLIENRTRYITVVLEDLFQPHNASAVLRSCDCFGIQDVHIIENKNKYEVNREIALGSSKWLTIYKYNAIEDNTIQALRKLKTQGYKIVATTPHREDYSPDNLPLDNKIALLFGTELTGLTRQALDESDMYLRIPMFGFTESLNISVSVAVILHYLTEKLHKSDVAWQIPEEGKTEVLINWCKQVVRHPEMYEREFFNAR